MAEDCGWDFQEDSNSVAGGNFTNEVICDAGPANSKFRPYLVYLEVNGSALASVQLNSASGVTGPIHYPPAGQTRVRIDMVGPDNDAYTTNWPGREQALRFTTTGGGNQTAKWGRKRIR